jgi:hypothetical protein
LAIVPAAFTAAEPAPDVLYRVRTGKLVDTKHGSIAAFQKALSRELKRHQQADIEADGLFGAATREGIVALYRCKGFEDLRVPAGDARHGAIDTRIWRKLMRNTPQPGVAERAFVLMLTMEGTDYDRAEWNLGTPDAVSVITWGPYGATAGGGEVQAILAKVDKAHPKLLNASFGRDAAVLRTLAKSDKGAAATLLEPVWKDDKRKGRWLAGFAELGANAHVRAAYDDYAMRSREWIGEGMRLLYALIPDPAHKATEVDFAFFLQLAAHVKLSNKMDACRQRLALESAGEPDMLAPHVRRRIISETMASLAANQPEAVAQRGLAFYKDYVPDSEIAPDLLAGWRDYPAVTAADAGLCDTRLYWPDFMK